MWSENGLFVIFHITYRNISQIHLVTWEKRVHFIVKLFSYFYLFLSHIYIFYITKFITLSFLLSCSWLSRESALCSEIFLAVVSSWRCSFASSNNRCDILYSTCSLSLDSMADARLDSNDWIFDWVWNSKFIITCIYMCLNISSLFSYWLKKHLPCQDCSQFWVFATMRSKLVSRFTSACIAYLVIHAQFVFNQVFFFLFFFLEKLLNFHMASYVKL